MTEDTLRAALRFLLSLPALEDPVTLLWHAGEPLTAGLAFFRLAAQILREENAAGVRVMQSVQTNGTLLSDEWCEFFAAERFTVGISVDGPRHVHDHHRHGRGGRGSHDRVLAGIAALKRHAIPLHAIAVLTPYGFGYPDEIFEFFSAIDFETVGFNIEETEGLHVSSLLRDGRDKHATTAGRYHAFMSRLFELWVASNGRPRIREFQDMSSVIARFMSDRDFRRRPDDVVPFRNLVVARDGDISTFSPELASGAPSDPRCFSIGNVHTSASISSLRESAVFRRMSRQIKRGITRCAAECEYFPVCGGGSPSNKFYEQGTFDCSETATCKLHRKELTRVVADRLRHLSSQRAP